MSKRQDQQHPERTGFQMLRAVGSSAEPYVSHGDPLLCKEMDHVPETASEQLYLYERPGGSPLMAWTERSGNQITLSTASKKEAYRVDGSACAEMRVVARVVGAVQPVTHQRAEQSELTRILDEAKS